mgnify:FL=1
MTRDRDNFAEERRHERAAILDQAAEMLLRAAGMLGHGPRVGCYAGSVFDGKPEDAALACAREAIALLTPFSSRASHP